MFCSFQRTNWGLVYIHRFTSQDYRIDLSVPGFLGVEEVSERETPNRCWFALPFLPRSWTFWLMRRYLKQLRRRPCPPSMSVNVSVPHAGSLGLFRGTPS